MELKEYHLIKIIFILFILLFSYLFYLDKTYSPQLIKISSIDKSYFNKIVKIAVKIEKQRLNNQTLFLILSDLNENQSKINAVIFKINKSFDISLKYQIIGRISLYKNEIELLIENIRIKV